MDKRSISKNNLSPRERGYAGVESKVTQLPFLDFIWKVSYLFRSGSAIAAGWVPIKIKDQRNYAGTVLMDNFRNDQSTITIVTVQWRYSRFWISTWAKSFGKKTLHPSIVWKTTNGKLSIVIFHELNHLLPGLSVRYFIQHFHFP